MASISKKQHSQKTFEYKVRDLTLSFTLKTDDSTNLEFFAQLLDEAKLDVEKEILKLKHLGTLET